MEITRISDGRDRFMELLLMGDEQESMVRRYLGRGELFVLYDDGELCGACVLTDEGVALKDMFYFKRAL